MKLRGIKMHAGTVMEANAQTVTTYTCTFNNLPIEGERFEFNFKAEKGYTGIFACFPKNLHKTNNGFSWNVEDSNFELDIEEGNVQSIWE